MIILDTGDTIRGDGSAATVIDYQIYGIEQVTALTLKNLADGQLAIATGTLYTAPASTTTAKILIVLVNTDTVARTVNLFHLPSGGTARRIIPKDLSLSAGYSLHTDGNTIQVYDISGALQNVLSGTAGGDLTGSYPNPTLIASPTGGSGLERTANKGAASGYASLNGFAKVVENPANATATATASKIPIADANGLLATWLTGKTLVTRNCAAADITQATMTMNGTWVNNGLNLSSIIPAGAVAAVLKVYFQDDAALNMIMVRQSATNSYNNFILQAQVANGRMGLSGVIPIDSDRLLDYYVDSTATYIDVNVMGWFI